MPIPNDGESRDNFIDRCIPIVIADGTADDPDQAVAVCNSIWTGEKEGNQAMQEKSDHKWYMSSFVYGHAPEGVDREKGIVYGAAVVTEGEAKGHDVFLDSSFLKAVEVQGNAKTKGIKARFGHPSMSSTALGTFLGRTKNFRIDGNIVRADLYLSKEAKNSPGGDLYEYVLGMAENEGDMFGISIVFRPGDEYQYKDGEKVNVFDWTKPVFVEMQELLGTDLVDDPAANSGLFSGWNSGTLAQQCTEFLDTHPDVIQLLADNPGIVDDFLSRYNDFCDRRIKNKTSEEDVQMEDEKDVKELEQGEAVVETVETEDASIELESEDKTKTEDVAESEAEIELSADENISIELESIKKMVEEFGSDMAVEAILNGGGYADAKDLYFERLRVENERLSAQIESVNGNEEPVSFQDADGDQTIAVNEKAAAMRGLSPGQAAFAARVQAEIQK